jgi:hypothetical protein
VPSYGRQRVKTPERRALVARDAFPSAPFQVNGFQPCGGCAAHHWDSDEVWLRARCRIWRLKLTKPTECVENFIMH